MKNIVEFPDRGKIEQEAVDWLIRLDGDTPPTKQDMQALKEWIARSPAHLDELEKLNAFWGNLSVLTELNIPMVKPALLAMGQSRAQPSKPAKVRSPRAPRVAWGMAASILLAGVLLLTNWLGEPQFDSSNGYYATSIGKQSTITLVDGSSVRLNTNSQIKVDYQDGHRNIYLVQGEAHFDVAHNKAKPFRVYAGKGRVQAVGTSFTVYLREKDIKVLVTEGKVALAAQKPVLDSNKSSGVNLKLKSEKSVADTASPPDDPEYYLTIPIEQLGLLVEGQGATILVAQDNLSDAPAGPQKVELMDAQAIERRDAWRQGLLLFAGDSLEDVVAEISRYTTMSIEIVDPTLKKIRIGGQFRVGDISGMFDVFEANFGLSVTVLDKNHVQISAKNKTKSENKTKNTK